MWQGTTLAVGIAEQSAEIADPALPVLRRQVEEGIDDAYA